MEDYKAYATGQTPQVGDVVKVSKDAQFGSSYYKTSCPNGVVRGKNYTVEAVTQGTKSVLIQFKNDYDSTSMPMRAKSFDLVESVVKGKAGAPQYIARCNGASIFNADKNNLDTKLTEYLAKNPSAKIDVYEKKMTVECEKPKLVVTHVGG